MARKNGRENRIFGKKMGFWVGRKQETWLSDQILREDRIVCLETVREIGFLILSLT